MTKKYTITVIAVFCLFCFVPISSGTASADEIVIDNGDRITGKIIGMTGGILTIETGYSDPVKVQTSKIRGISTDGPAEVHLTSGEIIKGSVRTDADGDLLIGATDERATAVFGLNKVAAINPPPVEPSRWTGSVSIGAGQQSGNTERTNLTAGFDATRKTAQDRFSLRFLHNYAKEEQNVTTRSYFAAGKYDYFFTTRFYGYIGIELLKDKVKNLNLRASLGPGVGYQFWDDAVKSLSAEAGLAYFSEDLAEGEDRDWITARLAGSLSYRVLDTVIFTDQLVLYPSLENAKDFKLRNEAALTSPLAAGWSLKLANILDHDSNPPEDIERNDWYSTLALLYGF